MRGKDIGKFGLKLFMLIYVTQLSVVNPRPWGLSVWVTITGRDGLGRSCHAAVLSRPEDKHARLAEASSWG